MCGRLQCVDVHRLPNLGDRVTVLQHATDGLVCWSVDYDAGRNEHDTGAVDNGTPCGDKKVGAGGQGGGWGAGQLMC